MPASHAQPDSLKRGFPTRTSPSLPHVAIAGDAAAAAGKEHGNLLLSRCLSAFPSAATTDCKEWHTHTHIHTLGYRTTSCGYYSQENRIAVLHTSNRKTRQNKAHTHIHPIPTHTYIHTRERDVYLPACLSDVGEEVKSKILSHLSVCLLCSVLLIIVTSACTECPDI